MLAGHGGPGVTGLRLLDSFPLDVALDLAYELVVEGMGPEGREDIDRRLAALDEGTWAEDVPSVAVTRSSDGKVVHITKKRLEQIRANRGKMTEFVGSTTRKR